MIINLATSIAGTFICDIQQRTNFEKQNYEIDHHLPTFVKICSVVSGKNLQRKIIMLTYMYNN